MPRVKIDYVVSFSSEDSENPANSLLAGEVSRRKWLGEKGQASHSVVLQLAKSAKINTVTIGSHHAGLVEVLVGRSERPTEPFKVLVLSSVFMTPSESKKDEAVSKVRTFQYEQLAADTRDQSWDRIRVVCLQPYNKHVKYGLSFIHIFESEGAPGKTRCPSPLAAPGTTLSALPSSQRFQISANSSDDEDTFKPGELFAKMNNSPKLSVDAQIRQASKPSALKNTTESPARLFWKQHTTQTAKKADSGASDEEVQERVSRDKDSLLYKDEERPNDKIDKIMKRDREEKEKKDREQSSDRKSKDDRKHTHKDNGHSNEDDRKRNNDDIQNRNNDDNHNRKNDDSHNRKKDDTHNRKTGEIYDRRNEDSNNRKNYDKLNNNRHSRKESHDHRDRKNDETTSGDRVVTPRHIDRERSDKDSTGKANSHARHTHSSRDEKKDRERNGESSRHSLKRRHSPDKDRLHSDKKLKAGPRSRSPHRLMSHVVFVLSGYQNPRRGTMRDKALAMGARYRPDWGDNCTHLICAYDNTPKLRQVRSCDDRAVIVKGDWIDDCCSEQRLLPWQWYATETEHRVARPDDQSEPEEDPRPAPSAAKVDSECDTDDEIQKVLDQKDSKSKSPKRESPSRQESKTEMKLNSSEESVSFVRDERFVGKVTISDSETDSYTDEESPPKQENVEIDSSKSLPDFFDGYTFSVDPDLEEIGLECDLLKRYITAYSGELVEHITEESVINYILSVNPDCVQRKTVKFAAIVKPEWVWRCHEKLRKVSSKDYIVK